MVFIVSEAPSSPRSTTDRNANKRDVFECRFVYKVELGGVTDLTRCAPLGQLHV